MLTNIDFADVNGLRLNCNAVLIEENLDDFFGEGACQRIRGFGPDAAWPVFTLWLKPEQLPFTVTPGEDNSKLLMGDGDAPPRPLFSGNLLKFTDGLSIFLQASKAQYVLDVYESTEILNVWDVLDEKVQEYWDAPNMPHLAWYPPKTVKRWREA